MGEQLSQIRRAPGWYIPWLFVAAFGAVFAVNGTMVWFALTTYPGLVSDHASEDGLKFNRTLAAAAAQQQLGWQADLSFADQGGHRGQLGLTLLDQRQAPLAGAVVQARFIRPTSAGHDLTVILAEDHPGHYGAAVDLPLPGLWQVDLEVQHPGGHYHALRRLTVAP